MRKVATLGDITLGDLTFGKTEAWPEELYETDTSTGTIYETNFNDFTSEVDYSGTQGACANDDWVWVTAGRHGIEDIYSHIWECDRDTLEFERENKGFIDDELSDSTISDMGNMLQTSYYYDGLIYGYCREPEVHLIDPDTLEYADESYYDLLPPEEVPSDHLLSEGITRYDGDAFSNPKWFVCDRADTEYGDRCFYRLDEDFNYEDRYLVNETNPSVEGRTDGYDGIELFDIKDTTIMVGSVTSSRSDYPNLDVFEYSSDDDDFYIIGSITVEDDELHTPDEGFFVHTLDQVYAGLRHPDGDEDSSRRNSVNEMDWTNIIEIED